MPRIYVASLSDYNNGRLHGEWIDVTNLDDGVNDVWAAIKEMLEDSPGIAYGEGPAEEYAIHDHEGFGAWNLSEYESIETVVKVAAAIAEHGEAVTHWIDNLNDVDSAIDSFDDAFIGELSALDYAYDYVNDCVFDNDTPETLKTYFDYDAFARDLVMGGDVVEIHGYLFNENV